VVLANSVVLISGYFAVAVLFWGIADATMSQPRDLRSYDIPPPDGRKWRVAHLADLHTVGERYGFRIESGRSGPCGNGRLSLTLARLDEVHAVNPLDVVLVTGDLTDAGRSAEWAEFFTTLAAYPRLAPLVVALPGNHDVNVVDRASPARMDLPTSPTKRLRRLRAISALHMMQGERMRVLEHRAGHLDGTLADMLAPHAANMVAFADTGSVRLSRSLARLWTSTFPLILPPDTNDGLGIIVLNSNAETHFSFTNALGLVSAEQGRGLQIAIRQFPEACWIVALHHHVVEYPLPSIALTERIGLSLANASELLDLIAAHPSHVLILHGHRHRDWIGANDTLTLCSAPSVTLGSYNLDRSHGYFHVYDIQCEHGGRVRLERSRVVAVA